MQSKPYLWTAALALGLLTAANLGGCGSPVDKEANDLLVQRLGETTVTVFPAFFRDGAPPYEHASAQTIAAALAAEGIADATVATAEIPLTSKWGHDQSRMFRDSAADFATYVKAHPPDTAYALLPEYLMGGKGDIVGVHVYIVDAEGRLAYGRLFNSHHAEFNAIKPRTAADATTLVLNDLREQFHAAEATKTATPARLRALTPDTAVTIYPVIMVGGPRKDVADVIGLMLERDGMTRHDTTESQFVPGADDSAAALAASFTTFLLGQPPTTDYALCVQFCGTPQSGPEAVRLVLAERGGNVVWTDEQTPADPDFKRIAPRNPMTCCVLAHERVQPVFGLPTRAPTPVADGRFERRWERSSNRPDQDVRDAMEDRLTKLRESGSAARVLVFPVRVRDMVDRESAAQLVAQLNDEHIVAATLADTGPLFELRPSSNEQRVLWDLAHALQRHVRETQPDADYVLYADYLMSSGPRPEVGGVHFVVCDRAGEFVIVDFQNEYQDDFKAVHPDSRAACGQLVARRLKGYLE